MEKNANNNKFSVEPNENEHNVIMHGRKSLEISGVKQIESFDSYEFLLETIMGYIAVKGDNLQMKNLDVDRGIVSIQGKITDISYLETNENSSEKSKNFFSKLFK